MYIEKVLDILVQLMKNGGKNKCCVYNFVQCIYIKISIAKNITVFKNFQKLCFISLCIPIKLNLNKNNKQIQLTSTIKHNKNMIT